MIPTDGLKILMNFYNSFVYLFIYSCVDKQNVENVFEDINFTFHIQRMYMHFKIQNTTLQ